MGPFYQYYDGDGTNRYHNSWYADIAWFVADNIPWQGRGGYGDGGGISGQFYFGILSGNAYGNVGFRLVLSPTK